MNGSQQIQWQVIVKNKVTQPSSFEIMKMAVELVTSRMEVNFKNIGRFSDDHQQRIMDDLDRIQNAKKELFDSILSLKLTGGLL